VSRRARCLGRVGWFVHWSVLWVLILSLCACTTVPPQPREPAQSDTATWRGRLSLRIQSDPPQSLAAQFELTGNAQHGALSLSSPLGNTLASLRWTPTLATLQRSGQDRNFGSLKELTLELTGTALPIEALFLWLRGQAAIAPDWSVDLAQIAQGRLQARQLPPAVPTELRLILEPQDSPR
jgi:outer membrane lipoprotein LolB